MPNCLEYVLALLGSAKLGAVPVPVNARFKAHELGHVFAHADIHTLLVRAGSPGSPQFPEMVANLFPSAAEQDPWALGLGEAPALRQVVCLDDGEPLHGFLSRWQFDECRYATPIDEVRSLQQRVRIRDIGLIMYTSGTTARPKGCMLSHESVVRHGINVQRSKFRTGPEDRFWDPLPLFHIGGLVPMFGCLYRTDFDLRHG